MTTSDAGTGVPGTAGQLQYIVQDCLAMLDAWFHKAGHDGSRDEAIRRQAELVVNAREKVRTSMRAADGDEFPFFALSELFGEIERLGGWLSGSTATPEDTPDEQSTSMSDVLSAAESRLRDALDCVDYDTADPATLTAAARRIDDVVSMLSGSQDAELAEYDPAESKLKDRAASLGLELMSIRPTTKTEPTLYAIAEGSRILHNGLTLEGVEDALQYEETPKIEPGAETFGERAARQLIELRSIIEGLNALANEAASKGLGQLTEVMERETERALAITYGDFWNELNARIERES